MLDHRKYSIAYHSLLNARSELYPVRNNGTDKHQAFELRRVHRYEVEAHPGSSSVDGIDNAPSCANLDRPSMHGTD